MQQKPGTGFIAKLKHWSVTLHRANAQLNKKIPIAQYFISKWHHLDAIKVMSDCFKLLARPALVTSFVSARQLYLLENDVDIINSLLKNINSTNQYSRLSVWAFLGVQTERYWRLKIGRFLEFVSNFLLGRLIAYYLIKVQLFELD